MNVSREEARIWIVGDALNDRVSPKIWRIAELGIGNSVASRNSDGELEYIKQGDDRVRLQYVEPSMKIKTGRNWRVVKGKIESLWIDRMSIDYENESSTARLACLSREAEEESFQRDMGDENPFNAYGADDISSVDSLIPNDRVEEDVENEGSEDGDQSNGNVLDAGADALPAANKVKELHRQLTTSSRKFFHCHPTAICNRRNPRKENVKPVEGSRGEKREIEYLVLCGG